jgi:hypothetical protein
MRKLHYTRNDCEVAKNTLKTSGEDAKNTLETSGEDAKTTLEMSVEDVKTTLETSVIFSTCKLHAFRVQNVAHSNCAHFLCENGNF